MIKNIIEHPYGICDKQKVVYYTSPIDIKPNIDEEMDRIKQFFDYACTSLGSESVLGMRNWWYLKTFNDAILKRI